ncbi:hypothetical protein HGRIS_012798 [Hohenbuehelia grisea]
MNMSDSVVSVAESFLHDELSTKEEADLRESLYAPLPHHVSEDHNVPGGLDPFLSAPEEDPQSDTDPAGVSMFAALIERLLARFEFLATDLKFTIVLPGQTSLTLSVDELQYAAMAGEDVGSDTLPQSSGALRKISIRGVRVRSCNLRSQHVTSPTLGSTTLSQSHTPRRSPEPSSPASSSSSLDEETQMMMSQSIACFPPRPPSPSSSVSSSMYESAISTASPLHNEAEGNPRLSPRIPVAHEPPSPIQKSSPTPREEPPDDLILSLGTEPIVFELRTPSTSNASGSAGESSSQPTSRLGQVEGLNASLTMGVISIAMRAHHLRGILDIADAWQRHQPEPAGKGKSPSLEPSPATPAWLHGFQANLHIRGVVALLLPPPDPNTALLARDLVDQFFIRPLVPPPLSHGYVRAHIETIVGSFAFTGQGSPPISAPQSTPQTLSPSMTFDVRDMSILAFHKLPTQPEQPLGKELLASPILITDTLLSSQYPSTHQHPRSDSKPDSYPQLPTFDIVNYADAANWHHGTKQSMWRTRPKAKERSDTRKHRGQTSLPASPRNVAVDLPTSANPDASDALTQAVRISINMSPEDERGSRRSRSHASTVVKVDVVPLQVFIDLGHISGQAGAIAFLDEALDSTIRSSSSHFARDKGHKSDSDSDLETPPATPKPQKAWTEAQAREQERRRLERLVLEDLDLDIDYQTTLKKSNSKRKQKGLVPSGNTLEVKVSLAFVRVQVRCPSQPDRPQRSGALVLDLHGIDISTPTQRERSARFQQADARQEAAQKDAALFVSFTRILLSSSLAGSRKAVAFISIGPLAEVDRSSNEWDDHFVEPLKPVLSLFKPSSPSENLVTTAMTVDVPSVHVVVSKDLLDGLQYWADDISQFVDSAFGGKDTQGDGADGRDASMIGSRFFAKSRSGSGTGSGLTVGRSPSQNETIVKVLVSEAQVRVLLPRHKDEGLPARPFDLRALDIDILMELKPEGKDETVLTLGIMDLTISDTNAAGSKLQFLNLTSPRSLSSSPKSMIKLRFTSMVIPETTAKETRINVTLWGFTFSIFPDFAWLADMAVFAKAPPGAFESVIPSERTRITLKIMNGSVRALAPNNPGSIVLYLGDLGFSTVIEGSSADTTFKLDTTSTAILVVDDLSSCTPNFESPSPLEGVLFWRKIGYALLTELDDLALNFSSSALLKPPDVQVVVNGVRLRLHLCADTLTAVIAFASDLGSVFQPPPESRPHKPPRRPTLISEQSSNQLLSSLDEHAFRKVVGLGSGADMIGDDLPTNLDYLDDSFSAAAGLRELRDDDLEDFDTEEHTTDEPANLVPTTGVVSRVGGETIKMLLPEPIHITENHFDNLPPIAEDGSSERRDTTLRIGIHNGDITLFLYDGYDWVRTRRIIEEEVREMRRRLAKIRQLVATGQTADPSIEETSALLFNSMYIGLEKDVGELEPGALIAAIDEELREDHETATQSTWEPLGNPVSGKSSAPPTRIHGKRLARARGSSIEIRLMNLNAEIDKYREEEPTISRVFATVQDLEILDHIKTSTWKKFLTELRSDPRGNVRETESNMVRVELLSVHPVHGHPSDEARLKAKILPLRLYVDQDALDFLKKFFSFKDPEASPPVESDSDEIYFQHAEVFPVDIKLDYKPRRVDYRALKEGKTIELMNFFHFDGAEMTLRHITLSGITGWPRFFDLLNDLWTPDVKATQLVDVISGVAPIRSMVNVGSGFADLVLLPLAQYKKDGRIVRGVQKGATSFVKSTAMEAVKMGVSLATGTQVILEQAEGVLGGQFAHPITTETLSVPTFDESDFSGRMSSSDDAEADLISKYAEQPTNIKEGVQSAYTSMRRNLNSAAQTILAVPMEVYERSGNEGPVRAVIRAVPIAVLKPMIGASEAVSKTLMGLHNTLDPSVRQENQEKYKQR